MPNASATYQMRSAPGSPSSSAIVVAVDGLQVEAVDADLEPAQRLLQRLLERAADRHHLADRLHLRGQAVVGLREFLEREARHLGDDVVDRRLERRRRRAAGDVVRAARRACSRRRAWRRPWRSGSRSPSTPAPSERDTRGFISMTTMRPSSGLIANCTFEPPVSTPISRSTAIDASRMSWYSLSVSVCAGATVIESPVCTPIGSRFSIEQTMMQLSLRVAHHLHLELFPAEQRLLDQQLAGRRQRRGRACTIVDELLAVVGDAAAGAAERERRPDHRREADLRLHLAAPPRRCARCAERAEPRPIRVIAALNFSRSSALSIASREAPISSTPYFVEHAFAREVERAVERRLAAHRRQQRVRALLLDDASRPSAR